MLMCDRQKILGEGGFATVFEGTWGGVKVAVKRILLGHAATTEQEEKALKMLDHVNVIKLFHVEEDQDFKMFVLELCDASMDKLFLQEDDPKKYRGPMPPETEVLLQLAKGLAYIHQMELVHRDIKPQNVLISFDSATQQVVMKWADFGFSKRVNERGTFTMSDVRGTYDYFAPEILKYLDEVSSNENEAKKRGTVQSDVFAEGLVFGYFLSKGVHPFGSSSYEIGKNVRTKKPINLPRTEIRDLLKEMFEKNPNHRVESSTVVQKLQEIPVLMMFTLLKRKNRSLEEIEKLINEGVNINAKNRREMTPLLRLAESKKNSDNLVEIVSLLIQHGANVNSVDRKGKNALLLWCENHRQHRNKSFLAIINLFVSNGIDINCKDKYGDNALTLLCEHYKNENLIDITKFLIKSGFNVTKETRDYFQRNYDEENRNEVLQLLNPPTKGLRNVSWCYLF
ncbi:serine/threonine-protein kinase/endoribonuclease IRE1-like isoform X2 [Daphnia pulicaria]|uniref:serine/threonine-protein kinase/endoribonuclease IRE1-like isoform X2 n=1 Tax=Daphnia pulicaria TaxID=35523 RepID=UPI001EE9DFD3|nr:serine/threonine-protein kinase/endoribonuclease IRE1-like isoform X2 [Daphnia pulicaria]